MQKSTLIGMRLDEDESVVIESSCGGHGNAYDGYVRDDHENE